MTETQKAFYRALCAPFPARALFSKSVRGQTLTYLKAPTIMNRLDDVAGVGGWQVEYVETDRGYICTIGIEVPVGPGPEDREWLSKSDGGGYEGMTKNSGGATIEDTDNDEKSAFTNAFRRAAYAWGIGRYLWKAGVADYLGDEPTVPDIAPEPEPAPAQRAASPPPQTNSTANRPTPGPRPSPASRPAPAAKPAQGGGYDNFSVPRSGRALFAWAKGLEAHYDVAGIVKIMDALAKQRGYQGKYVDYDDVMVADVAWGAIETIKGWECYQGEFDHVLMPECLASPQ